MYLVYQNLFDKLRKIYFRKVIKDYTKKGDVFLDYGCGPGDTILIGQEYGLNIYGIDSFPRSVKLAKKRKLNVLLGNYQQLKNHFSYGHFNQIFLQSVVEHMTDPITELSELQKFLKPHGLLIISSPTPSTYFWDDPTHVRPYTPKSFKILAEVLDMKPIFISYVFSYLLNFKLTSRIIYLLLNILPFSLGSNLIGVFKKRN